MNINIALEDDAPPTSITCSPEEDALLDGDDDTGTGLEEEEASQGARQKQARPMTETTKQAVEGIHHRKLILEQMIDELCASGAQFLDELKTQFLNKMAGIKAELVAHCDSSTAQFSQLSSETLDLESRLKACQHLAHSFGMQMHQPQPHTAAADEIEA